MVLVEAVAVRLKLAPAATSPAERSFSLQNIPSFIYRTPLTGIIVLGGLPADIVVCGSVAVAGVMCGAIDVGMKPVANRLFSC